MAGEPNLLTVQSETGFLAHAKRMEYEIRPAPARLDAWSPSPDNIPSLEREPWRALRSCAVIHFVGPSWWREWDPENLPQQLRDELLATLEARWAMCVAYWHLQSHGSLEHAVARTLELNRRPLDADPKRRGQLQSDLARELDLIVNAGLVIRVKRSGRISFTFESYGMRLVVTAIDLRTRARQFCIAAAPNFCTALAL